MLKKKHSNNTIKKAQKYIQQKTQNTEEKNNYILVGRDFNILPTLIDRPTRQKVSKNIILEKPYESI